jgi:hypothetical protein
MSGIEAAAVGVATEAAGEVARAGAAALQSRREVRRAEHKAIIEAASQTEGFKKAAEIRGKKLAVKEQLSLSIMRPLSAVFGISREYFETDFSKDFAVKIADVPEENLQTPKASIAGPVMEGIGYSLDEPELKGMYLELLARASDDRVSETAHPSFVQTIRQITATEARYLPAFLTIPNHLTPIVQYRMKFLPSGGSRVIASNVLNLRDATGVVVDPMLATYVDNWIRLKLVEVTYDAAVTGEDTYAWELDRPERQAANSFVSSSRTPEFLSIIHQRGDTDVELEAQRGAMTTTALGFSFGQAAGLSAGN